VLALSFGTATFGGGDDFFKAWGSTDAGGASRLIDICLDHGVSMFDSADVYSSASWLIHRQCFSNPFPTGSFGRRSKNSVDWRGDVEEIFGLDSLSKDDRRRANRPASFHDLLFRVVYSVCVAPLLPSVRALPCPAREPPAHGSSPA